MVERLIMDEIKPEAVDLLIEMTQRLYHKIQELQAFFRNNQSEMSGLIVAWLDCSTIYYRMITGYALFVKNNYMSQRLIEKTKDVETIYFENNLLANSILDTKDAFKAMADKFKTIPTIAEFPVHGLNFFNEKLERELLQERESDGIEKT